MRSGGWGNQGLSVSQGGTPGPRPWTLVLFANGDGPFALRTDAEGLCWRGAIGRSIDMATHEEES